MEIIGNTFNQTYENYKAYFIYQHGTAKFEKAYHAVVNSDKIKNLLLWSRSNHNYLGGADYSNTINSIFYFMFKNNETTAMGVLIAIKYWNDNLNACMGLCADSKVNDIAINQLRQYCASLLYSR
jgi:hypothetical protein